MLTIQTVLIAAIMTTTSVQANEEQALSAVTVLIGADGGVTVNGKIVTCDKQNTTTTPPLTETVKAAHLGQDEKPKQVLDIDLPSLDTEKTPGTVIVKRSGQFGHFMVRVKINGVDIDAAIDTGAAQTFLTDKDAKATGAFHNILRSVPAYGIAGGVMTNLVQLDAVEIAGTILGRVTALAGPGINVTLLGLPEITRIGKIEINGDVMKITPR